MVPNAHLWRSQFGFRKHCSTEDAIYIVRRTVELANARGSGSINLLALDWKKCFDSVHVGRLVDALRRSGITRSMLRMISSMLRCRQLVVHDCGHSSNVKPQLSGISQGCTLSLLLFLIVMTVLMEDANTLLSLEAREAQKKGNLIGTDRT